LLEADDAGGLRPPVAQGKAGALKHVSEMLNVVGIESSVILERTIQRHSSSRSPSVRQQARPATDMWA
jgi:hypothetical protein